MGRAKVSPFEQPMRKSMANGLIFIHVSFSATAPPPPPPPLQPRPSPRMRTCSSYHEGIVLPYELPAVSIWSYISSIDFVLTNHAHYNSSRTRRAGCMLPPMPNPSSTESVCVLPPAAWRYEGMQQSSRSSYMACRHSVHALRVFLSHLLRLHCLSLNPISRFGGGAFKSCVSEHFALILPDEFFGAHGLIKYHTTVRIVILWGEPRVNPLESKAATFGLGGRLAAICGCNWRPCWRQ